MSDFKKIIESALRDLYIKMVEVYTESIKNNTKMNESLIGEFMNKSSKALNSTDAVNGFITKQLNINENIINGMKNSQQIVDFLIGAYDAFGIEMPPEGFLQIDAGSANWWKTITKNQGGYFTYTIIFDIDNETKTLKFGKNAVYEVSSFDPSDLLSNNDLKSFLIDATKTAFQEQADSESDQQMVEFDDVYFLILDEDGNSFKINTNTKKLYIRVFFNEYGQKLASSITNITGISEIKKIPQGIRKNFLIGNLLSGIDAINKYFDSQDSKQTNSKRIIDNLKTVKELLKKIIKKNKLNNDSTVGFVFDEEFRYLALVNANNKSIGSKELRSFLKEDKELNIHIAILNYINCQIGEEPEVGSSVGASSDDYQHFSSVKSPPPISEKEKNKKKIKFQLSQSKVKFVGDIGTKLALEGIRKNSAQGATVVSLYENYFNKIDLKKIAEFAVQEYSQLIPALELKKIKFAAFISSLDITEIIDCVAEQAGGYEDLGQMETGVDASGNPIFTETVLDKLNFEKDLKMRFYDSFSFFYNAAKGFDSEKFNFPSSQDPLPIINELLQQYNKSPNEENYNNLNALVDQNFPYIAMIPQEQTSEIYNTIVNNEPQYRNNNALVSYGIVDVKNIPGFQPSKFISFIFKRKIVQYVGELTEHQFDAFYGNIAEKNKKLRDDSALSEQDMSSAKGLMGSSAKKNKNKLPKVPHMGWFNQFVPTLDYNAFVSIILGEAYDKVISSLLSSLMQTTSAAAEKKLSGDGDMLDKLDPGLRAAVSSNDLTQNALDSFGLFNSPEEFYIAVRDRVFPNNMIKDVKCLFERINVEVSFQTQVKFLKHPAELNDPDTVIMQNIFIKCGLPSDITTINNFFLALNDLIDDNVIQAKLKSTTQLIENYLEICGDNNEAYLDNLRKFLSSGAANKQINNETSEARAKLMDLLSFLNGEKLRNSAPQLFCNNGTNNTPVFDNQYSPLVIDSQNKLLNGVIKGINNQFNNDIGKFKPIILEQTTNLASSDDVLSLFGNDPAAAFTALATSGGEDIIAAGKEKNDLKNIILDEIKTNLFFSDILTPSDTAVGLSNAKIYLLPASDKISSIIIFNNSNKNENFKYLGLNVTIDKNSVTMIIFNTSTNRIIFNSGKISDSYNLEEELKNLTSGDSDSFFKLAYTDPDGPSDNFQYALKSMIAYDDDYAQFNKSIIQNIMSGILSSFVETFNLFDTANFNKIPFKDKEDKNYLDGGILCSPEVFSQYQDGRDNLQCYVNRNNSPDSHELSQLASLYQLLINTCIVQELLELFFILNLENIETFKESHVKKLVIESITNTFSNSLTKIGSLQVNFEEDLKLIYHYEQIKNGNKPEPKSTGDIISYFVDKFFPIIINKLQSRVALSVSGYSFSESKTITSNIINKNPDDEEGIYKLYNEIDTASQTHTLNKIKNGIILQRFVDIRQHGDFFASIQGPIYADTTLPKVFNLTEDPVTGAKSWSQAGYEYFTFTEASSTQNASWPIKPSQKDPEASVPEEGNSSTLSRFGKYRKRYSRTQGKISFEDFEKYYEGPWASQELNEIKNKIKKLYGTHGPETYFKKVSVGVRLCLVLDKDDNLAKNLMSSYESLFSSTLHSFDDIRFVVKEKIIDYGNKVVIPLLVQEKDLLPSVDNNWKKLKNTKAPGQWINYMLKAIKENYKNNDLADNLKEKFLNLYKTDFFDDLFPLALKTIIEDKYEDKLDPLFDFTKEQIIRAIYQAKAVIDEDWQSTINDSTEDPNAMYLMLALSLLPILIQFGATFVDPSWKQVPITPLGYLAKILSFTQ